MAPLPPDNTPRYFLDYDTCGHGHTLMCRVNSTAVAADVAATISAFLTDLAPNLYLLTVTGFRFADAGTNVSLPVTWTGDATYGDDVGPEYASGQYYDFVGRSPGGRRVRVAVFGAISLQVGDNYRISVAESTDMQDALAELVSDVDHFLAIDFGTPIWNQYANSGVNAYWRNKIR